MRSDHLRGPLAQVLPPWTGAHGDISVISPMPSAKMRLLSRSFDGADEQVEWAPDPFYTQPCCPGCQGQVPWLTHVLLNCWPGGYALRPPAFQQGSQACPDAVPGPGI